MARKNQHLHDINATSRLWLGQYGPSHFEGMDRWQASGMSLLDYPLPDGRTIGDMTNTDINDLMECFDVWEQEAKKREQLLAVAVQIKS